MFTQVIERIYITLSVFGQSYAVRQKLTLLVRDRVQQNPQCPHILFFASISLPLQNFWCSIIYSSISIVGGGKFQTPTYSADKDIEGSVLDVSSTSEVDQFYATLSVQHNIFVLDVAVDHKRFGV